MTVKVLAGHVLDVLAGLPPKSVHVAVTSPPYWGLRAYGTPPQVWGGSSDCAHEWGPAIVDKKRGQDAGDTARVGNTVKRVCPPETQQGAFCQRCGAWRGELGSEPTLDLFVRHLVEVFAAVGRVLRDDGTLWVNLGDSYAGSYGNQGRKPERGVQRPINGGMLTPVDDGRYPAQEHNTGRLTDGLKAGDLCMAPARFALAMQEAGWRLRSEITLCKTAPMPESVSGARFERCRVRVAPQETRREPTIAGRAGDGEAIHFDHRQPQSSEWADCPGCPKCEATDGLVQRWGSGRPTSATEKLYVFAKAGHRYFYDLEAVRVRMAESSVSRLAQDVDEQEGSWRANGGGKTNGPMRAVGSPAAGRNLWNYLMWRPEPLAQAHYAAYPRWLPRLAIQAGTSERGVCPGCGAPWLRVVGEGEDYAAYKAALRATKEYDPAAPRLDKGRARSGARISDTLLPGYDHRTDPERSRTLGWRQSCRCPAHEPCPSTVLDPFAGSGTTVIEANALGRHGIGVELQSKYVDIAHQRLAGQPLSLFAHDGAASFEGGAEVDGLETTKQEQHPNRTGFGLPPLVEARDRPVGVEAEAAG